MEFDLRNFRKAFKLKQSDLSNMLGIPQSFISEIENGKASFPEMHYETLKEKYGKDVLEKYILDSNLKSQDIIIGSNSIAIHSAGAMVSDGDSILVNEPAAEYFSRQNELNMLREKVKQLEETIALLKALLEDKERTIQLLMNK